MPATPRDLLKPRSQRLREVMESVQQQAGQANAQQIVWGLEGERTDTNLKFIVTAGEATMDGVSVPQRFKATAEQAVAAGAALGADEKCYVLVELVPHGTGGEEPEVKQTVSAKTGGTPVLPELTAGRIAVFYLSLEGVFTPGTTALTATTIKPIAYSAGNIAPTSGF